MLSFIDVFSSYNQIPMYLFDTEKTVFITPFGTFCYNVMFFSLKNVRATYQQLMTKIFYSMLGKTTKVYIDDILIKNKKQESHCTNLQQDFDLLQHFGMKFYSY